jgi:hypothetical protein
VTTNNGIDDYPFTTVDADNYATVLRRWDIDNGGAGPVNRHLYEKSQADPFLLWSAVSEGTRIDTAATEVGGFNRVTGYSSRDGAHHAVWTQTVDSGAGLIKDVFYSRQATRGGAWTAPRNVSALPLLTDSASSPSVAVDKNGRVFVAFQETSGTHPYSDVCVMHSEDNGATWITRQYWTNTLVGERAGSEAQVTANPEGDIWLSYIEAAGAGLTRPRIWVYRLDQKIIPLAPIPTGNWTLIGQYKDTVYMPAGGTPNHSLSSASHTEFLMTWNGYTTAAPAKWHHFADWYIRGLTPGNVYALDSGGGTILEARAAGLSEYRGGCSLGANKVGLVVDDYTVHGLIANGDFRMRVFWIRNNVATFGYGPNTATAPCAAYGGILTYPNAHARVNGAKMFLVWNSPSV